MVILMFLASLKSYDTVSLKGADGDFDVPGLS
jgi:hypothetical protein